MNVDPFSPPLVTEDLPGIGGRIKSEPEDFEVEEIASYEPSGEGSHLYLWVEKRDMSAEYFARQIARRLDIKTMDIGTAGRKDRRAITRQWVSLPDTVEERLDDLNGEGMRILKVSRHTNKLKTGHLQGNRFRILIRDVESVESLELIVTRIREQGLLNYYGAQRFGLDHETGTVGLDLLRGEPLVDKRWKQQRKFVLSAGQSVLFNLYLGQRLKDGLTRTVLSGDVMGKWPRGGMFVAEDVSTEQSRFDVRETVTLGPIFGRKTFQAHGVAAESEQTILDEAGIDREVFSKFGKMLMGTRRQNLIYVDDLSVEQVSEGVRCQFSLPSGSYATILMRELMKAKSEEQE